MIKSCNLFVLLFLYALWASATQASPLVFNDGAVVDWEGNSQASEELLAASLSYSFTSKSPVSKMEKTKRDILIGAAVSLYAVGAVFTGRLIYNLDDDHNLDYSRIYELVQSDPRWLDASLSVKTKAIVSQSGCGSWASFVNGKALGVKSSFSDVLAEYNSGATSYSKHRQYFSIRGYCFSSQLDFEGDCAAYRLLARELEQQREVMISMSDGNSGHVEALAKVFLPEDNDNGECFGVTNSGGRPAIIRGGKNSFYHSVISSYRGPIDVRYEVFSICSEGFCETGDTLCHKNLHIERSLDFPVTSERSLEKIRAAMGQLNSIDKDRLLVLVQRMEQILYRDADSAYLELARELKAQVLSFYPSQADLDEMESELFSFIMSPLLLKR